MSKCQPLWLDGEGKIGVWYSKLKVVLKHTQWHARTENSV